MTSFFGGKYEVSRGKVYNPATGEEAPLKAPATPFIRADAGISSKVYNADMLGSFEFTFKASDGTHAFLESLWREPDYDGVFHLADNGQVIARVQFVLKGEPQPPRWYYVSILDKGAWRYALRNGLQLEDAVRELNWQYRDQDAVRFEITTS